MSVIVGCTSAVDWLTFAIVFAVCYAIGFGLMTWVQIRLQGRPKWPAPKITD